MANTIQEKTCAIYTRKSSDEGLDRDFNTLDAQREACEAYILSQKSEGWRASEAQYNDGGYSGGNLNRPGIKQLIEDIRDGKVQTIVVYKIDRLTRSLSDFSKLVDVFDEYDVTFVSVTQNFNTTTSMGRLTLNVLLSFAQFEREVTGERIRDKVAASKKKGMWVTGIPPIGFYCENSQLKTDKSEIDFVLMVFERYLKLGSVHALKLELDAKNIRAPIRTSKKGKIYGGKLFTSKRLYSILNNPAYIGKIKHKDEVYDGLHDPVVSLDTWERVQKNLENNAPKRKTDNNRKPLISLLKGRLFDINGVPYSPSFSTKRNVRHCYYVSQNLLQYRDHPEDLIGRIPSAEIERVVEMEIRNHITNCWPSTSDPQQHKLLQCLLDTSGNLLIQQLVEKVTIDYDEIEIKLNLKGMKMPNTKQSQKNIFEGSGFKDTIVFPYTVIRKVAGAISITSPEKRFSLDDMRDEEVKRLIQGIDWRDQHFAGATISEICKKEGYSSSYVSKTIFKSFETLKRLST